MSTRHRSAFVLLFAAIFVLPRSARAQDVSGAWTIEYPVRISNHGGVEQVDSTALVTLTLAQEGEAVEATWQMEGATRTRVLQGTVRDGLVTLSDTMDATVMRDGGVPTDVRMVNFLELRLRGDQLVGTQSATSVDGSVRSSPRTVTATRNGTR